MNLKKTPIFFLSVLLVPFFLYIGINYTFFDTSGGVTLLGAFSFFCLVMLIVIFIIEQLILRKIEDLKKVWIIEIVLILFIVSFSIIFSD